MVKAMPKSASQPKDHQHKGKYPKQNEPVARSSYEANISQVTRQKKKQIVIEDTSRQTGQSSGRSALEEKLNRKYSFKRASIRRIFSLILRNGLQLPEMKRPYEAEMVDDPLYCHYHRCLGHAIEDCIVFKDMIERKYRSGEITLSDKYLLPEASVHVISHVGQMLQPETRAHICMISTSKGDTSLQEGEGSQSDPSIDQVLWQIIRQKEEEIANLRAQNKELSRLLQEAMTQRDEFKREAQELRRTVSIGNTEMTPWINKRKGKETMAAEDTVKQTKITHTKESLQGKLKKRYSFERKAVRHLFDKMLRGGLQLPKPKRPEEMDMIDSPDYCPYHRCIGHVIEDCFVLKDLIEAEHQAKNLFIADKYLTTTAAARAKKPPPLYLSSSESSDGEQIICELANIAKNSKLLEQVFSSKLSLCDGDNSVKPSRARKDKS